MKAVVFTDEPGSGEAYIASFKNPEEAEEYAARNGVVVLDFDDLFNEIYRLRQWMKSAYGEFQTARDKMMHAHRMLQELHEFDEPLDGVAS